MKILGVLFILLGIVALVYGGITYKQERTALDIGPIQAKVTEKKTLPLPPLVGALALATGLVLVLADRRRA